LLAIARWRSSGARSIAAIAPFPRRPKASAGIAGANGSVRAGVMVGIHVRVDVDAPVVNSVGDASGISRETFGFVAAFTVGGLTEVWSGSAGGGVVDPAVAEIPAQPIIKNTAASKQTGMENRAGIRFFEVIIQPK
jgi:hypothetical protein